MQSELVKDFSSGEISEKMKEYSQTLESRDWLLISKFLSVTVEALRLEFGFGQKRIERYGKRVNSILDSINQNYVGFEDLLA